MSKVLHCLLLLAYTTFEIVAPLLLRLKGSGVKISFAELSEMKSTKSMLTYKPVVFVLEPAPAKVAAPLQVIGNESRLWFLFLDSPEVVFLMQNVEIKTIIIPHCFFLALNADLLQTCLELISAFPASSSFLKDSS